MSKDQYYTAHEAAEVLGLKYHTFLSRVRKGHYEGQRFGWVYMFLKTEIDEHVINN